MHKFKWSQHKNYIHAIDLYRNSDLLFMYIRTHCDLAGALRKVESVTRFGEEKVKVLSGCSLKGPTCSLLLSDALYLESMKRFKHKIKFHEEPPIVPLILQLTFIMLTKGIQLGGS